MSAGAEASIAGHYRKSDLEERILTLLSAAGVDISKLKASDLAPVDEFHIGGAEATGELAKHMKLKPGMKLLDVGSGIGGPARFFAENFGCAVSGVDLTPEYVQTAKALSARVGLQEKTGFQLASAMKLPFDAGSFDGAYVIHVGMNLPDKAAVFGEVRRVVKGGGRFAIFDLMRTGAGELNLPVPWASDPAHSFVETPQRYRELLAAAGFSLEHERDRREYAIEFFERARQANAAAAAAAGAGGSPLPGLHVIMGEDFRQKTANVLDGLQRGIIAPFEMVAIAA